MLQKGYKESVMIFAHGGGSLMPVTTIEGVHNLENCASTRMNTGIERVGVDGLAQESG
jgi:hypothetical protein